MYRDSSKKVSHVLGSVQMKNSFTKSSSIGDMSKGSTVGLYLG